MARLIRVLVVLGLTVLPVAANAQGSIAGNGGTGIGGNPTGSNGGGCTNDCTFTGTTTSPILNASSASGAPPLQIAGTGVLNLIANQTSPIVPGANNITYGPTGLYVPSPIDLGYAETINSSTSGTYLSNITDKVTVSGTMPNHWGELTIFQSVQPGSGVLTGEVNIQSNVLVLGTGNTFTTGGGYESALNNDGTITGAGSNWKGFYTVANNDSGGTITGKMIGFADIWSNANTTAATVAAHIAFQCNTNASGGSAPTVNECLQNNDATQAMVTLGQVNVGSISIPASTVALKVNGTATYTLPFQVVTSGGIIGLMARDTGEVDMQGATVNLGINGTTTATITASSSDTGNSIYLTGGSGGSGASLNISGTLPTGTGATWGCFSSGGKLLSGAGCGTLSTTGTVTFSGVSTVGTIAGSVCMTSANLLLYESGATGCTISLETLKRDIKPVSSDIAAERLMKLRPIAYNMKDNDTGRRYGFGAIQVHSVDPELSTFDGRGDLQAFDPNGILALAVATIQQQQVEIDALKRRVK